MGERQAAQRAVAREVVRSYAYVATWMSISTAVILFNKWLLAYSGFPYPIALTMWHMAFCSSVAFVAVRVLGVVKSHNMSSAEYARRVVPIGEPSSTRVGGSGGASRDANGGWLDGWMAWEGWHRLAEDGGMRCDQT